MNISHHFDDATLISYAAGALPAGMALLVACHLHWCPACRERVRTAEAVGGALLEGLSPVSLADDALERVMANLDDAMAGEIAAYLDPATAPADMPWPLWQQLQKPLDQLPWRRLGAGIQHFDLHLGGSGATRLLRIQPGVSVPHHSHAGNELTLVLRGSYSDEIGRFQAGDVADLDGEVHHQPIVDTGQPCICLIATDAPLKFTGLMGRLAQPFIGL